MDALDEQESSNQSFSDLVLADNPLVQESLPVDASRVPDANSNFRYP